MMQIGDNRAVALQYRLTVAPGVVVDQSSAGEPLWFLYGRGQLLPKFEAEIQGLTMGDKKSFQLSAIDGYGEVNAQMIVDVPKEQVDANGQMMPGQMVQVRGPGGRPFQGKVVEVEKATAKIDFNHPLAGQELNFDIEVVEVRAATQTELVHGHVHSDGDDHHH